MYTGCITCICAVPHLVQHESPYFTQDPSSTSESGRKPVAIDTWQLLTGHTSGHMRLWQASQQNPLQTLAIIRAAANSPVKSLVILRNLHLICSAHAAGYITLHIIPEQPQKQASLVQQADQTSLPSLLLASSSFEAHKSGLQQCVEGDTGLVSVGAFGSIMVWPEAELRSTVNNAGFMLPGRYHSCHIQSSVYAALPEMLSLLSFIPHRRCTWLPLPTAVA